MPYSNVTEARKKVKSLKGLSTKQVKKFIAVFNSLHASNVEESEAIAKAISAAKKLEKSQDDQEEQPLDTPIIKALDDEQMIAIEVVYEPYKLDAHGQWMRPETLRKACDNFNENLEKGNVKPNYFHSKNEDGQVNSTEDFEILKTWINEVDCTVGDQAVPEGTWICKLQYKNKEAWELRKAGVYLGVSLGGLGSVKRVNQEDE